MSKTRTVDCDRTRQRDFMIVVGTAFPDTRLMLRKNLSNDGGIKKPEPCFFFIFVCVHCHIHCSSFAGTYLADLVSLR